MASNAAKEARHLAADAFKVEILAVCVKHRLVLAHYRVEYDEYDSDDGFEVVPLVHDSDLSEIRNAIVRDK